MIFVIRSFNVERQVPRVEMWIICPQFDSRDSAKLFPRDILERSMNREPNLTNDTDEPVGPGSVKDPMPYPFLTERARGAMQRLDAKLDGIPVLVTAVLAGTQDTT
jgi:hypothetical protein